MKEILLCLLSVFLITSCDEETHNPLLGKWTIETAEVNGKATNMLDNLYLHFISADSISTNMFQKPNEIDFYTLSENKITQTNIDKTLVYNVLSISDSILVVQSELREGYEYHLAFKKSE